MTDSTYTDYGCVCDTIDFHISFMEIFGQKKRTKYDICPNPVTNWLKIQLNDNDLANKCQLEICSLSGQRLLIKNIYGNTVLNLSDFSSGIYLLTIRHNNKIIQMEKIIVKWRINWTMKSNIFKMSLFIIILGISLFLSVTNTKAQNTYLDFDTTDN